MANNKVSKANPDEARRLYADGYTQDEIAAKLGVASSTVGRYINGRHRSNEFHRLKSLLAQGYAVAVVAEELAQHPFRPVDLDDLDDWETELARLLRSVRHLQKHLRTLTTDTEGNIR